MLSTLVFEQDLSLPWPSTSRQEWQSSELRGLAYLYLPSANAINVPYMPIIYVSLGIKLWLSCCVASTLLTEFSAQPPLRFWLAFFWWSVMGTIFFSFLLVICYFVEMPSLLISIVHLNKPVHFIAIEVVECCAYSSKKHSWEQHWMVMSYLPVSVTVTQYVIFCSCSFAAVFILKTTKPSI